MSDVSYLLKFQAIVIMSMITPSLHLAKVLTKLSENSKIFLKGALSGLRQFLATESVQK